MYHKTIAALLVSLLADVKEYVRNNFPCQGDYVFDSIGLFVCVCCLLTGLLKTLFTVFQLNFL